MLGVYFYRTYTATVSGSATKHVQCCYCLHSFEYTITRRIQGGGHSSFMLNDFAASYHASKRARAKLVQALDEGVDPVHCTACGIYQPDMAHALRLRIGRWLDPNKYAAERIRFPAVDLWRVACKVNTKDGYYRFIEVWPTLDGYAKKQIKELRYPPHVRKLVSSISWMLWGALALCAIGIVIAGVLASR